MRFDVLTIFPRMFESPLAEGIISRARAAGLVEIRLHDLRDWTTDRHRTTDDRPFGGGEGMVMLPGPLAEAIGAMREEDPAVHVILLSPQGRVFNQEAALELAARPHLALVCGRYEGIDERVRPLVNEEISIGDFILSGGEPAAITLMDALTRLVPGALGGERSTEEESFSDWLLEYPQYTRPRVFQGQAVPEVLLSGDHERIRCWRRKERLRRTRLRRPELLAKARLTDEDRRLLAELAAE
ncbi:MAG: tRNA (guanosine(37)-N1)-methyltransferase TrmD [Pseudomonadota bacterium]